MGDGTRTVTRGPMMQAISSVVIMAGLAGASCAGQHLAGPESKRVATPSPTRQKATTPATEPARSINLTHTVSDSALPLSFEPNHGQTDRQVQFFSRGKSYSLFLTPTEAVLALRAATKAKEKLSALSYQPSSQSERSEQSDITVLRMKLVGANPQPNVTGLDELPGKTNYFIGNDPGQWRTNVPTYAKVQYQSVYPGVDLLYYGKQRQLEYDLVVAPGGDPNAIKLAFEGADQVEVDAGGDLVLHVGDGELLLHQPVVYQDDDGARQPIPAHYLLTDTKQVGFQVAAYDRSKPLVIDPVLSCSTYLGGSSNDEGDSIAVDTAGNAYVTGSTWSTDFPTVNPIQPVNGGRADAFVAKLNPTGSTLVYSTYLGGQYEDGGRDVAVYSSGNAYVIGLTFSSNFPTANALQPALAGNRDAFVARISE